MITNKSDVEIYETDLSGQILRRIDLADNYSYCDPEDIAHMYGNTFAIAEEKLGRVVYVDIFPSTNFIDLSDGNTHTIMQLPGVWPMGDGIEGVSYNPATNEIHAVSEITRQWYKFDESGSNINASLQPCTLLDNQPAGTDLSAIHHFGLTDGVAVSDRMLVLSDESNVLVEMDENCNEYSQISNIPGAQIEGVTMDGNGNIYVVGEPNELFIYSVNCRTRDSLILLDFKANISGLSWNENQPIDTWEGITLNENGCVKWLELDKAGVSGTISPSLGGLSEMTHLDLYRNDFTGPIPPELGNLSSLQVMDLNSNELSGTIPVELTNLTSLLRLNLASNDLTGTIPPELGSYPVLNYLTLAGNQLSGNIPPELGNLTELTRLYLNHNNLTGTIPVEIGDLSKLIFLRLDNNQLSGQIPAEIGQLSDLNLFYVQNNQFNGTIPIEFGNLTKLVHLYMHNNDLFGEIPAEFGNLVNLRYLLLFNNDLEGALPAELGDLPKLIYLRISGNDLSGCYDINLLNLCSQLTNSANVFISNGNNFDTNWEDFCDSSAGVCYDASSCRMIDSLALVDLYNATDGANWEDFPWDLTQPIDTWYGVALNPNGCVKWLTLDEQNLTGSIPPSIGNMQNLTHLNFYKNNLTGPIPPELGNLPNLLHLELNSNQFTGTIPVELANLPVIRRIALNNNQLTGTIPPELGNLTTLYHIFMGSNQLTGEIPASFGSLPNLIILHTSYNQLSGCYDDNLLNLCSQLVRNSNHYISNGNSFDTPWETFCSAGYCVQTRVEDEDNNYVLQNYPNPFSTSTTIEYKIPESATNPTLDIFDISGKLMHSQSINQTGTGTIEIQAGTLAPGVYHYRLTMGDAISATKRMVIMK